MTRDVQSLLDSAFAKLGEAEVELDHRRRWEVEALTPLEKVAVILNDLFCEAQRGGFDYWLQRSYCAKGYVELQRVAAAIVARHRELDPLAAEVILGMCEAVELAPASYDADHPDDPSAAEDEAYQALCDGRRFLDSIYYQLSRHMLRFNEQVVAAWDEGLDPFTLPAAQTPPRARGELAPPEPQAGPVRYPTIQVGLTQAGADLELCAKGIQASELWTLVTAGLYAGGVPLAEVAEFHGSQPSAEGEHDKAELVERCCAMVDVDGTLARTGQPADVARVTEAVTWTPAWMLREIAKEVRQGLNFVITSPDLDELGGGPRALGFGLKRVEWGEGALPLADQAGEADRGTPTFLLLQGHELPEEREPSRAAARKLLTLARAHGALIVLSAPEPMRVSLGFLADMGGVNFVNQHPDSWGF